MTPSFGIRLAALLEAAGVRNLVEDRIIPGADRKGLAKTKLIYTVVDDSPVIEAGGATANLNEIHAQLDCYAVTFDEAQELAAAVFAAFRAQTDPRTLCGSASGATYYFDDQAPAPHRVSIDLTLSAQETING